MVTSLRDGLLHRFPLGSASYHPWVVALRRSQPGGAVADVRAVLAEYYRLVRPSRPADWLGVDPAGCPGLSELPPTAAVLPWSLVSPRDELVSAAARSERERKGYGLPRDAHLGSPTFGPLADVQLDAEAAKLFDLREVLSASRLDPGRIDYDVSVVYLVDGDTRRWYAVAGRHRLAVMSALGADRVPVSVSAVVRRDEAEIWPQVAAGIFTPEAALGVFDAHVAGQPPGAVTPWQTWVDETAAAG
jgi:hypothetical protein